MAGLATDICIILEKSSTTYSTENKRTWPFRRRGAEVRRLVSPGSGGSSPLAGLATDIRIIEDPVALDVSSSKLRAALGQVELFK